MTLQLPISFHNTIDLKDQELNDALQQCQKQEDRIYLLMKGKPSMTPPEVMDMYNKKFPQVPLTSIRRAMTNLSHPLVRKLVKTTWTKEGQYGKRNYKWLAV